MSSQKSFNQILEECSRTLLEKDLGTIDKDEILRMKQELNPYGRTIEGSDHYLNFSITYVAHEYWKKFIITSMVAFMNRMCDEYQVPADVPVVSVYDYLDDPTKCDTPEAILKSGNESLIKDYEFNRAKMQDRKVIKEFLEYLFQYNPDEHVSSSYKPNYKNKGREIVNTMAARIAIANHTNDPKFRDEKIKHDPKTTIKQKKVIISKNGTRREVIKEVPVDEYPVDPRKSAGQHRISTVPPNLCPGCSKSMNDLDARENAFNFIPPDDLFAKFKTYTNDNYKVLQEATNALHCEVPNFAFAINPYSWHDTAEEAAEFVKKHSNEVISSVYTARSGAWCILDPVKENTDKTTFFNDKTIVIEEMMERIKKEESLAGDLLKKRVTNEKKKNDIVAGPDAEGLKEYKKSTEALLKSKGVGFDEPVEEIPDNAIQVDVWRLSKSGTELAKEKFYTKAEAPLFMKK